MKWIGFVELRYYKQHTYKRIEFTRGVNVIVGESDLGKSTILKAIKKCLLNIPDRKADSFLTWGAPKGSKTEIYVGIMDDKNGALSIPEETVVCRVMGKSANEYRILYPGQTEPVVYAGFGKSVPPEVMAVHGMRLIDLGYGNESLNFIDQFDGFFLISKRPEEAAVALGRLAHTEIIENVRDGLRSDISKNTRAINVAEEDIRTHQSQLREYDYLEDEAQIILAVGETITAIENIEAQLKQLSSFGVSVEATAKNIRRFHELIQDKTDYRGAMNHYQKAEVKLSQSLDAQRLDRQITRSADRLVTHQETLANMPDLDKIKHHYEQAEERLTVYNQVRKMAFDLVAASKKLKEVDAILSNAPDLSLYKEELAGAEQALELQTQLYRLNDKIRASAQVMASACRRSEMASQALVSLQAELKEMMEGKCPLCGQDVSDSNFETIKAHLI